MEPTQNFESQLDPKALKLMRAIRQHESGGKYDGPAGDAGTSTGAFQFQPDTWKQYAKEVLGNENAPMSKANQNQVAYTKIKGWKDAGFTPEQVAAAWNANEQKAKDGSWKTNIGHNDKYNVDYDTPAYVKSVMAIAKGKGSVPELNQPTKQTYTDNPLIIQGDKGGDTTEQQSKSLYDKFLDNPVSNAIKGFSNAMTFGGANQLGNEIGSGIAGQEVNYGEAAKGALKTGAGIGSLAYGGGLLSKALTNASAGAKIASSVIPKFQTLSNVGKYDALQAVLKNPEINGLEATAVKGLAQLATKLEPLAMREAGLAPGLLKSAVSKGASFAGGLLGKGAKAIGAGALASAGWEGANAIKKLLQP